MPASKKHIARLKLEREILLFFFLGTLLTSFFFGMRFYQARVLSFEKVPDRPLVLGGAKPVEVEVPAAHIKLAVEESGIVDGVWQISKKGASHLDISSSPGQNGNIVIYGHNKNSLFGPIRSIKEGTEILLKDGVGGIYRYQVARTVVVGPSEVNYVEPTREETLTLYTCTGLLDSKRFVVIAKPI